MQMTRGFRHTRSSGGADMCASQRTASPGTIASPGDSQNTRHDAPPEVDPPQQRGRKMLCETKQKMLVRGSKVALKPSGDM